MIAEGIVFDIPFDMSKYTREEILIRFTPYKDTSTWTRERIQTTADNFDISLDKDVVVADDMVIRRYTPDRLGTLANLYLTTGIFDVACPKLCRVDMLDSGSLLQSYPYFPDNLEYSEKIERAIEEIGRVSLFILDQVGPENLTSWRNKIISYTNSYISFIDREDFGDIGNRKIVKRIYKNIVEE